MSETPHLLIVESRYYEDVAAELLSGATAELEAAGASSERIEVPGAFEIPAAVRMAIRSMDFYAGRRRFDGYITLGCVIRGETSHYDYICTESARKLQDLAVNYTLALGYGILTCETHDQAMERAAVKRKNKGGDAARACLAMIGVKRHFRLFPR
ncbi:MAG: 6,7-dimethyl-8-ribityllumazine synthase [Kiloniellales bacterium]|nr:6,7-dimethyl-8-ribityllumazine synthase [Kiloniellales bacterium]